MKIPAKKKRYQNIINDIKHPTSKKTYVVSKIGTVSGSPFVIGFGNKEKESDGLHRLRHTRRGRHRHLGRHPRGSRRRHRLGNGRRGLHRRLRGHRHHLPGYK